LPADLFFLSAITAFDIIVFVWIVSFICRSSLTQKTTKDLRKTTEVLL